MNREILIKLQEIKQLTMLGAKKALTIDDASLYTGLSKAHLYKLVCNNKIPYYKRKGTKRLYFDKDELTEWMLRR
jgi:excisionase family DNA binding protein